MQTRYYCHGDEQVNVSGKYFCRMCDYFEDEAHFQLKDHIKENFEQYMISKKNYALLRRKDKKLNRPANSINLFNKAANKSSSMLYSWIILQSKREDLIGLISKDILSDERFPKGSNSITYVKSYLTFRDADREVIKQFTKEYKAYKDNLNKQVNIFISYSHSDEEFKNRIIKHLQVIAPHCNLNIWDDKRIAAGEIIIKEIRKELNTASIVILLISADFLSSKFILTKEIPTILKRRNKEGLQIIPFILKPCSWQGIPWLFKILVLPKDGRPLIQGNEYEREQDLHLLANTVLKKLVKKTANIYKLPVKETISGDKDNLSNTYISPSGTINQVVKGNNNIQIGRDINIYSNKKPNITILPPPDSIGSDPLLKQRIQELFNKIGDERSKRFGSPMAFSVLAKKFKTDFQIKHDKWTIIWTWPNSCAPTIIDYLQNKYNNTKQGRIEKAASRENYFHSRPQLYKMEKELLDHFGLKTDSAEVKELLQKYFGINSHKNMTHVQHWIFVKYLENEISKNYD